MNVPAISDEPVITVVSKHSGLGASGLLVGWAACQYSAVRSPDPRLMVQTTRLHMLKLSSSLSATSPNGLSVQPGCLPGRRLISSVYHG